MSRNCPYCGNEIAEGSKFCTVCGASSPDNPENIPAQMTNAQKPVSIWQYVGLMLLFGIPCIGLVALIVCIVKAKNKSLKNYAIAMLIYGVIVSCIVTICSVAFGALLVNKIDRYISENTKNEFSIETSILDDQENIDDFMEIIPDVNM